MMQPINKKSEGAEPMEYKLHDFEYHLDPDNNLLNTINSGCDYYSEEQFNTKFSPVNMFSLIHFNCRSLYKHFDNIKEYLSTLKHTFSVIALTETWLDERRGTDFVMDGYQLYHSNRTNTIGGGAALFIHSNLSAKCVECMTLTVDDLFECITVEINTEKKKNTMITCVYRTPNANIDTFNAHLENILSHPNEEKTFILCGDLNIDLLSEPRNTLTSDFLEILHGRGLYSLITKPSRITTTSATLIDHIFINNIENTVNSGLLLNDISDHLPVFCVYDGQSNNRQKEIPYIHVRNRSEQAINTFREELMEHGWQEVYTGDTNTAYEAFLKVYISKYDKHCPRMLCKQKNNYSKNPWISRGLQNACKKKNNLYRDFIKTRSKEAEIRYKVYKNKLTTIMRQAKKDYYCVLLEKNKKDIKGTWNTLKKVMGNQSGTTILPSHFINEDNVRLDNMKEAVNEFNSFFVNVGPKLAKSIENHNDGSGAPGGSRVLQSMYLGDVGENDIFRTVKDLKNKTSTDNDGIDMWIIKKTIDCIIKPLCYIFNLSFQAGSFPDGMKVAKITPFYKDGDKHKFTNYRPVSLLSQFSKILEKIFLQKLDTFIEKHGLLNDCQYGFRAGRSTASAVMNIVEDIASAIDHKLYTVGVFIDLKKAFDTIDHTILLSKLRTYGIRGIALDWLSSYLENRQQYVEYSNITSECLRIQCGIPQGSVLGPKLFILFLNDICDISNIFKFVLFADDTNFYSSGDNLNNLLMSMEQEMVKLKKWFDINKLSLNLKKTKFMIFSKRKKPENIVLSMAGTNIERVAEIRFLGVILDEDLEWKSHVAHVRKKISKGIFILNRVKWTLDKRAMRTLYCALILPYLNYCVEVWGNAYRTTTNSVYLLQKRAIRVIHHAGYRDHTNYLFFNAGLLKFYDLVELQTLLVMLKANYKKLPTNLQTMFNTIENEGRRKGHFKQQFARTTLRQMCTSVVGVKLWNSTYNNVKDCKNIYQLKRTYKDRKMKLYGEEEKMNKKTRIRKKKD